MSKRQWMVLLMLFLTYLLLGASIFYHIESELEIEKVAQARLERIEINALLHEHYMPKDTPEQHEILEKLTRYCGKSVYNYAENETDPLKWDFYNSFYFAYTVVSTIGYGNLAPTNMLSRVLMIFYGVVGIPMNGILLAQLGEFFGLVFVRAHKKYKSYKQHSQTDYTKKLMPLETRKAGLAAQIFVYLIPGFVMFIFFPAFLFSHYEGWSYDEAVYYAFVTLTTIGFGDYVAGQDNTKGSGVLFILYKSFLIAWISFGLGYIVMIMTFIARGMRSKKITRLEHKLAVNLKHTQSKIWNEFNKEVSYLRRVFNELQLSKVKRIYLDDYDDEAPPAQFQRSNSFPDLRQLVYGGLANPLPPHPRRRANSEVVPAEDKVARVVSETDLQRIDKTATFATHAMVQPAELLARLVNILGYMPPQPDDMDEDAVIDASPEVDCSGKSGVQGFSDKEILASETRGWNNSMWKLGGEKVPIGRKPRSRASSEIRLDPKYDPGLAQQRNVEWTWSGPSASRKIQEIIKARRSGAATSSGNAPGNGAKETKSKFSNLGLPISVPKALLPRWIKSFSANKRREAAGGRSRNSLSIGDLESGVGENYLTQPSGGFSVNDRRVGGAYDPEDSSSRPYFTHTGAADLASTLGGSNLLEETSLADFLRALTALHTRVALPDEYPCKKPQRKMGTASLTPPKLPSLLALFSPPHDTTGSVTGSYQNTVNAGPHNLAERRFSLRNADNTDSWTQNHNNRRSSLAVHPGIKPRRRFSLRPVTTPLGSSPQNGSPYLSGMPRRGKEWQGPASPVPNSEGFVVECPRASLVLKEGAPGVSSPITSSSGVRRFSLRPTAQIEPSPQASGMSAASAKLLPRWRAGMLQRQINQMNLQRRVRAFSLSDVASEGPKNDRGGTSSGGVSPLVEGVRIVGGSKDQSRSSQKTVTILTSKADEGARKNDSRQTAADESTKIETNNDAPRKSKSMVRAISATNNPFVFPDENWKNTSDSPFGGKLPSDNIRSLDPGTLETQRRSEAPDNGRAGDRLTLENLAKSEKIALENEKSDSSLRKKESTSSCSTVTTDTKSFPSRKVSAVSIGAWTDSRRNEERKFSNVSLQSADSMAGNSRKSSTNPSDKPRVSIDSYKPLMEIKLEKPSEDPFERYRATMMASSSILPHHSLTEDKVESGDSDSSRRTFSIQHDNRESST